MTFGYFEGFPQTIHHIENYLSSVSNRQLQQRLIQFLGQINGKEFAFEEVAIPTMPEGTVIFEFGLADENTFGYLDAEESARALEIAAHKQLETLDFYCSIRYYKGKGEQRIAQKFDYYMLRLMFGKGTLNVQVHHERGPRYLSPADLLAVVIQGVNAESKRKILKESKSEGLVEE